MRKFQTHYPPERAVPLDFCAFHTAMEAPSIPCGLPDPVFSLIENIHVLDMPSIQQAPTRPRRCPINWSTGSAEWVKHGAPSPRDNESQVPDKRQCASLSQGTAVNQNTDCRYSILDLETFVARQSHPSLKDQFSGRGKKGRQNLDEVPRCITGQPFHRRNRSTY